MTDHDLSNALPTDAVEMVRAIRNRHYEATKNMTREEKREFDRKRSERFELLRKQVNPDLSRFPFLTKK